MEYLHINMLDKLSAINDRHKEVEELISSSDAMNDMKLYVQLSKEYKDLEPIVKAYKEYRDLVENIVEAKEILSNSNDAEMKEIAKIDLDKNLPRKEKMDEEIKVLLIPKDPADAKNAVMEIRAGTGGEEAGLFASNLYRMYSRLAQRLNWNLEIINSNSTGIGGLKEITFQVRGDQAYSKLKHESGVHRVQRVPTTESSGRIHTSAATVAVLPEAEEVDVEINQEDLQIDIYHASGHGGQNVQKVATAVRIKHIPSGVVTTCQDERSQHKNKEKALAVLRSRLLAAEIEKQQQEITDSRRSQVGSGDRSERVRTYNFPQGRITDHRIGLTSYNLEQVLDGDLMEFIEALVQEEQARKLENASL